MVVPLLRLHNVVFLFKRGVNMGSKYVRRDTFRRPSIGGGLRPTRKGGPRGTIGHVSSGGFQPGPGGQLAISFAAHQARSRPRGEGNPGIYYGRKQINFIDKESGAILTNIFHVIQAIEGTWLSAACRAHGWGAVYGPEHGYGAYVECIVRREDGSCIWPPAAADKIKPGELFAIEIYKGRPEGKRRRKSAQAELFHSYRDRLEVDEPTIEIATVIGLVLDLVSNIFEPLAFFSIPFNMATVGRDPVAQMAELRAQCYAITAFVWREHEGKPLPLSRVFRYTMAYKRKAVEKAWNDSWARTTLELKDKFESERIRIYKEVAKNQGDVTRVGAIQLREYLKKRAKNEYVIPARHCDKLMESAGDSWKNRIPATIHPLWELYRKTKYPN